VTKELMPWKVYRLGRRARGTGLRARRALRRLLAAGERLDQTAINELWDLWLDKPDKRVWAALSLWRRPRSLGRLSDVALGLPSATADVITAARRHDHPIAATARAAILAGKPALVDAACEAAMADENLAAFCTAHGLAPSDPRRATAYFLLTGQHDQYLGADPDHSLLALVYQGAGAEERSRIRAKAAGHPDLVRVLADTVRRGRMARLSDREGEYLVDAFAQRRDWPGLWELARDLPVLDAAAAVRRIDGWRPDGPAAAMFDALAAAAPADLARSHRAVTKLVTTAMNGSANGGSFSPDGTRLAVGASSFVSVFTLAPGAAPVYENGWTTPHNSELLAFDDGVLIMSRWEQVVDGFSAIGYTQRDDSTPRVPGLAKFHRAGSFGRTTDGFAALTQDKDGRPLLHLVTGSGPDFFSYQQQIHDVQTGLGIPEKYAHRSWTLATEPGTDRIAIAGDGLYLAGTTGGKLHRLAATKYVGGVNPWVTFTGPGRLLGVGDDKVLRAWQLDVDELVVVAKRKLTGSVATALPAAGVAAVIHWPGNNTRQVRYLDLETLVDIPTPRMFDGLGDPTAVFSSPDGTHLAVGYYRLVAVTDVAMAALADRPLAATTPADLHTVRARLDHPSTDPAARPFLALLHTCLEHRSGTDIALGSGAPATARPDDIALGGPA
jgi:hypothetical protein